MDLLEKWIWEKYRKHISHKQLIDASEIDLERSAISYSLSKQGDLIIPLTYDKDFWGQLIVKEGSDLTAIAITQIIDLTDLYFKLKVSSWTAESRAPLFEERLEAEFNQSKILPRIFYLKCANSAKANFIVSFLQERLGSLSKFPWNRSLDLEDKSSASLLIHIEGTESISKEDLLRMAYSQRTPQIVITSSVKLSDWHVWAALNVDLQTKLAIVDADLDSMPMVLSEAKDCIDLLWFAD